jgi:peptidoglycan/LPS O-acetylase OafA/YrhL
LRNISQLSHMAYLPGVFENNRYARAVDGSLWSLWVEVRLYVLVALCGVLGLVGKRWLANSALTVLLAVAVFEPAYMPLIGEDPRNLRVAAFFGLGAFAYINRSDIPMRMGLMLTAVLVVILFNNLPFYDIAFAGILAYGTLFAAFAPKLSLPTWVRDYSYGIFIYGFPIQQILASFFPTIGPYKMTAIALPIAWIMGAASWFLVEAPMQSIKRRTNEKGDAQVREDQTAVKSQELALRSR